METKKTLGTKNKVSGLAWSLLLISALATGVANASTKTKLTDSQSSAVAPVKASALKSIRTIDGQSIEADETGVLIEETMYVMRDMIQSLLAPDQSMLVKGTIKLKPDVKAALDNFVRQARPTREISRKLQKSGGARWQERALILAGVKLMNLGFEEAFVGSEGRVRALLNAENSELNGGVAMLRNELDAQLRGTTPPAEANPEILSARGESRDK